MTFGATPPPSPRPPRSRARRFAPLGVAAWMVLEIWLLTVVGGATNGLTVFLLLLAGVIAGSAVIKRAGRRAWRNLTGTLRTGDAGASRETGSSGTGNTLPMIGGLLLILPGLLSDVLGLLCLFPPTGRLILRRADKLLVRPAGFAPGSFGDVYQQVRMHQPDGKVVPGEVVRPDGPGRSGPHGQPGADGRGSGPGARQDPPLIP
ncbi:FxsA family protein [Streptomyces sp. RS10V-4]|uniref:FxsA family membrane protein n=1 Tax=Streptomyces rhizoryzae TaxID=2932493 RepID=UPI00200529FA|nr:FxsA family membrane protein [Streptomyces rhizoryzae]MCK7621592.1 FxsA family protein [Streptomyces rhizoryzae]